MKALDHLAQMSSIINTLDSGIAHFNKLKESNIIINGLFGLAGLHFRTIKFFVATPGNLRFKNKTFNIKLIYFIFILVSFVYGILTENSDKPDDSEKVF